MMPKIINFIMKLSNEDYDRFIKFLNEGRDYPYFSSLYDLDDFHKDIDYFNEIYLNPTLYNKKEEKGK